MKKILKTALIIALGLVIGGVSYTFNQKDKSLLLGDLSDALPGDITSVDFAYPSGSITPSNGVVTITSVNYATSTPTETGLADQADILASSIYFEASTAENCSSYATEPVCPVNLGCEWGGACTAVSGAGVTVNGNKIYVPAGHYPINIDIYASDGVPTKLNSSPLYVSALSCENLQMQILRGQGSGAYTGSEDLPTPAESDYFDFNSSVYATGSVTITAGDDTSGDDTYLVTIGTDPGTAVSFDTDLNTTATAVALDITNNIVGYTATAVTNVVNITKTTSGADANVVSTVVVDSGGTVPTATSAGMTGGGVPIETIVINNPIAAETGQQTFAITFNFVDTLAEERAVITSSIGDGTYEISVKDEGVDTVATSENFIYAINDLLGIASPFIATIIPGGRVKLFSKELGTHTNDYTCMINNAYFPVSGVTIGNCFSGATAGDVDVLTQPFTMDNTMTQGDTALIYIAGGIGATEWGTSHPSVLEVVPFGEIGEGGDEGTVVFIPEAYSGTDTIDENSGTYNLSCETTWSDADTPVIEDYVCAIDFTIPVTLDAQDDYEAIVYLGNENVTVSLVLDGGELQGVVTGSGTYSMATGLSVTLEGTVSGNVSGNATGIATGLLNGIISTDIQVNASVGSGHSDLSTSDFVTNLTSTLMSGASIIDGSEGFISTVKLVGEDAGITNYAILYAKRAGTSILTVTDELTCVAALEVEVLKKKIILDMVGKDPSDVFELGESVQINAYLGSADGELDENENITYAQGIEWISSNPDVATIDGSGVLSIVAPGIVNIMATYYVGDAEIDPVQSDPMTIKVSKITGLTIALDEAAQAVMSNAELNEAYESVLIILNDPKAAGRTINVEGTEIDITLTPQTPDYNNDLERIENIITNLRTDIEAISLSPAPTVSTIVGLPGILILQPASTGVIATSDANGYIDISTTAVKEDLTVFPNFSNGISLPASETYGLMVIADYDNGRTKRLNTTDVTWVNTPLNYLEQTALEAGLIKMGGITGTSTVTATYENADGTIINSNQLTVNVDSGPAIEYARRIQSGSITQGSRITLRAKVTDVDTIADISEITTSIVRSTFSTYQAINSDTSAVWFTAEAFEDEVRVESESAPAVVDGEEGGEIVEEVRTTTVILNYKTYSIPIEIPVDEYLYDGNYKLILSISDAGNHTSNFVLPIYIGEQASGDVSADGTVNMVDVILAFQIASDPSSFTQAQLEAADMNHMGGVTMIDVILLFNRATIN